MGVIAVATSLALCGTARDTAQAQDTGKPQPIKAMAKEADPDWEVATIKPSDPNDRQGHDFFLKGRRVALRNTTARQLLLLGYSVQKSQLAGLPDWAISKRWDVDGTPDVEGQPSLRQMQGMVRKLLAERFGLQLHHEQREMPVFALTMTKGRSRLSVNARDPNGWLQQMTREDNGRHMEELKNVSMAELAIILQYYVALPVVDQTGLKGRYDFNLQWTPDDAQTTVPDPPPGLFTAIREQLGLKLERVKAPADVLVIDKIARPEAN
jgi:uncharacterized protein (TIGR03435 family)